MTRSREEAAAVLGVEPDAPPEDIRAAYRERVMETHPDHGGDEAAFRRVCWAYDRLRE
nr:J domain-containing protein [Halomarina salina]